MCVCVCALIILTAGVKQVRHGNTPSGEQDTPPAVHPAPLRLGADQTRWTAIRFTHRLINSSQHQCDL